MAAVTRSFIVAHSSERISNNYFKVLKFAMFPLFSAIFKFCGTKNIFRYIPFHTE